MNKILNNLRAEGINYLQNRLAKKISVARTRLYETFIFLAVFFVKYFFKKYRRLIIRKKTTDTTVFFQIFISKEYDPPVKLSPKLIIDGGANVGYTSVWLAEKYPAAEIIAIEPESANFEILKKNTEKYKNIKAVKAALWPKNIELGVSDNRSGSWGFSVNETSAASSKENKVAAIKIDELLRMSGQDEISILKLDIEGAEKELFAENAENWLGKVKVIMIELHDRKKPGCSESFYSATSKYQWDKYERGENITLIKKY